MTDVIMPQMGESIAEGTVTKWLKKIGDTVKRDEPLFEISTDKVDAEIPAPIAGVLTEILVQPGATVEVGTVVGKIGVAGSTVTMPPPTPTPAAGPAAPAPQAAPVAAPAPPPQPVVQAAPAPPTPKPAPPQAAPAFSTASPVPDRPREGVSDGDPRMARSSPVVRKIASEHSVDITQISGTGLGGRVTRDDILSYVDSRKGGPAPRVPAPSLLLSPRLPRPIPRIPSTTITPPPVPGIGTATVAVPVPQSLRSGARVEVVPMSPIRKKTADHMVMSKRTSAHVSTVWEVDMTRVASLRAKYKKAYEERSGVNLTYTPFIVKAATDSLKLFKVLNASVEGDAIVYHKEINIGIAVALDWGLIVPVIQAADEKNILGLARTVNDLGERARTKKLKVDEVQGGTFTITNPGVFGSLFGTPIISQPQVAILGVGTIEKRPVIREDAIAIRTMAYFCLTFDHRIIDGSEADKFMAHFKNGLQNFDESAL